MHNNITDEEKKKEYFENTNKLEYIKKNNSNKYENKCHKKVLLSNSHIKNNNSTINKEDKNCMVSPCNNIKGANKNFCDFHNSYVNVLYFKKLKLNKKLYEKLKDKHIVIYLKYKDSTCSSENIEIKSPEINNLFLCFLITEPFLKEEKKIVKIYIKYFKDNKYKILSFGFLELNFIDFSEKFYRKKTYLLCYDKNNNKYIFGYFLLILANQKKWQINNNKITYEHVNKSYFVCNKNNYDKQIFYICRKIQKNILESFNKIEFNQTRNLQKQELLKHFSVTQSCPSTFTGKNFQKNNNDENNKNLKNYKSLTHFNELKNSNNTIKDCKLKNRIDINRNEGEINLSNIEKSLDYTNRNITHSEESNILINSYSFKKENTIYFLSNTDANNYSKINLENFAEEHYKEFEKNKINSKRIEENNVALYEENSTLKVYEDNVSDSNEKKSNNCRNNKESYKEETDNNKYIKEDQTNIISGNNNFDLLFCEKLQNILNNDLDNFVKEVQFILNHLKKKMVKKNNYFISELKNRYKNEVTIKNNSALECKKKEDGDEQIHNSKINEQAEKGGEAQEVEVNEDVIKILENCVNTTSLYIKCVLKDKNVNTYERDMFLAYEDIIINIKKALCEYIRENESLEIGNLNANKSGASLSNSNKNQKKYVKNKKKENSKDATNREQTKTCDENYLAHSKTCFSSCEQNNLCSNINSDETLCSSSSYCTHSSINSSRSLNEKFKVNNYLNKNISTAFKYYENKWKNKLLKMRNYI